MKRLFRFAFLTTALAAVLAAVKAMRRPSDPLPTPATSPSEPWPPLRTDAAPTPDAAPAPNTPDPAAEAPATAAPAADVASAKPESTDEATVRLPEPDGVPVAATPTQGASWTQPAADGGCPDGYPIKAKMSSKIFHCPGQLNYDRTTPDRCYVDEAAAEADGLRAAKR